jgi:hypothetical protein
MSKSSLFALLVSLGLATTLPGCEKNQAEVAKSITNRTQPTPAPTAAQDLTSDMLVTKLAPYILCLNDADGPIQENVKIYRETYTDAVAHPPKMLFDRGFRGFRPADDTNYQQARHCVATLKDNAKQTPSMPDADKAATEYASALEALIPLMKGADHYYDQQNFSDDKLEEGRALNNKLQPLLARLYELSTQVRDAVGEQKEKQRDLWMTEIEKTDGKTFPWYVQDVLRKARRAFNSIRDADVRDVDSKTFADAEASMQQAYDAARAYGEANRDVQTESGKRPMWFQLEPSAQAYLQRLKSFRRAAEGKEGLTGRDSEELLRSYNALVRKFRDLSDMEQE